MICAIAMFCQDIREEKAGTVSLVGIFPDNISVAMVPFAFPKMAIYARFSFLITEEPPKAISMRLLHADGTETPLAVFDEALIKKGRDEARKTGSAKAGFIGTAMMAPFMVKQGGRMNVVAKIDDEETVCGTLNVQLEEA